MAVARTFLDQHYTAEGHRLIRHYRNTFWTYTGSAWPEFDEASISLSPSFINRVPGGWDGTGNGGTGGRPGPGGGVCACSSR
jgi:hypothetical protein